MNQGFTYLAFAAVAMLLCMGVCCGAMALVRRTRASALARLPRGALAVLFVCAIVAIAWKRFDE